MNNWLSARASTLLLATGLSLAVAVSPVLAGNGKGGGNGGGGGHGNGGNGGNGHSSQSHASTNAGGAKSKSKAVAVVNNEADVEDVEDAVDPATMPTTNASAYGKLNGFLHASPTALAKASPNSAIGKVSKVYAGLLQNYLAPADGSVAPTPEELAAALAAAANKPLDADIIGAVNDKLLATNPDLAAGLVTSGKTSEDLATEIAAAL